MDIVKKCVVNGCKETDANDKVAFYRFPEDECMRKRWLMAIRKNNFMLLEDTVICSKHFLPEGFISDENGIKILKNDSVPSIFSIQDHYHEIEKLKQKLLKDKEIVEKNNIKKSLQKDSTGKCISRSNVGASLILKDNSNPDDNIAEPPVKQTRKDSNIKYHSLNVDLSSNVYIADDDENIREISAGSYKFDNFEDSTTDLECLSSLSLPDTTLKIERLAAYHESVCKKQMKSLQQKMRRRTIKIKKQYRTIKELCIVLSELKRH